MTAPTLDEFTEHGEIRLQVMGKDPKMYRSSLIAKFLAWDDNDWHTLGKKSRKIKNWKSTLTNSLPYLKANKIENSKPIMLSDKMKQEYGIN